MTGLIGKTEGRPYQTIIGGSVRLTTTTGIDAFAAGSVLIHVSNPSQLTAIQLIVVRCTAASGVTAPMTAGVEVLGTEIYPDQELIGLTVAGKNWLFPVGGASGLLLQLQPIQLVISAPPTGTSQTIAVDVFGHEL